MSTVLASVRSERAIHFVGVSKAYPRWGSEPQTLRAALRRRIPGQSIPRERRWALRDITYEFEPGRATGLIGPNGAGKSTMLRLASGVGAATRGRILIPQNTASVLNLGYVFDPTLTGRENALTAALMAGMSGTQARATVPAVIAFAELEAFAEAPMRTYSEGMKLRLAFGVIAQLNPDALLLDEVMAVGDLRFQAKCLERVDELRDNGATILFATHSLEEVRDWCDRAVWLQAGALRMSGDAAEVVEAYETAMHVETVSRTPPPAPGSAGPVDEHEVPLELGRNRLGSQEVQITEVIVDSGEPDDWAMRSGGPLSIRVRLHATRPVHSPIVAITMHRLPDEVVCIDLSTETMPMGVLTGDAEIALSLERLALLPGEYMIDAGVYKHSWEYAYDVHIQAYYLMVRGAAPGKGVYVPEHGWRIDRL